MLNLSQVLVRPVRFTVKNNQPGLFQDIALYFKDRQDPDFVDCSPPDHGRIEIRKIWTTTELNGYRKTLPGCAVSPLASSYEVFKVILRESCENNALQAVIAMQKGTVVDLKASLAIAASRLSLEYNLPMADSIILATAQEFNAVLWTQDSDFKNISNVKYFSKK